MEGILDNLPAHKSAKAARRGSQHAFKIDCKQTVCLQHLAGGISVMKHAANAH